jgi:hypothetical protein
MPCCIGLLNVYPVVHIPKRIGHERLGLVVPPLAINDEFVLMIPAQQSVCHMSKSAPQFCELAAR